MRLVSNCIKRYSTIISRVVDKVNRRLNHITFAHTRETLLLITMTTRLCSRANANGLRFVTTDTCHTNIFDNQIYINAALSSL